MFSPMNSNVPRLLYLLAAAAPAVFAAPSFRGPENDRTGLDLGIRTLFGAEAEPLPPARIHTYTVTSGRDGSTSKIELHDPRELWYASQWKGQWRDKAGNRLIVGRATRSLPVLKSPVQAGHVDRAEFEAALADPANAPEPGQAGVVEWAAKFAGVKLGEPQKIQSAGHLGEALFLPVENNPRMLAYLFRAKPPAHADWCAAVITIADGTPAAKVRADFERDFLGGVRPQRGGARPDAGPKSITPQNRAADIPGHPSREAAKKSITGMKNWWFAETPGYIILSDLQSAEGRQILRAVQSELPVLFQAFSRVVPPFTDNTDVSVVRMFSNEADYKRYVSSDNVEWSVGLWHPSRRELLIMGDSRKRDDILSVIRHEGFHQYLFYASDRIPNAVWFNEGHACYFDPAVIRSGNVTIPENAGRVYFLDRNLNTITANIPTLLKTSHADFYNAMGRDLNYTTAWALVYFLRKGAPSQKITLYDGVLPAYLKSLAETKDSEAATAAAFEGIDMPKFQRDFAEFWKNGRARATAKNYNSLKR